MTATTSESLWHVMFCCNHPENGDAKGYACSVEFGIGEHNLTVAGTPIRFRWLLNRKFDLQDVMFNMAIDRTRWVGNWCWDACYVESHAMKRIAEILKKHRWEPEHGSTALWELWEQLDPSEFSNGNG